MNRRRILQNLTNSFESYTKNGAEKIVRSRKYIPSSNFVEKNLANGRKVFDKKIVKKDNLLLLTYYQMLIQEVFSIRHPDRNTIINEMLNIFPHLIEYNNAVIYKFDLKDFYRSIDIEKILYEIKENKQLYLEEVSFLEKTLSKMGNLSPGLGIVNSLTEILGHKFDREIQFSFDNNPIFYSRYVDDCILVFDEPLEENDISKQVRCLVENVFGKNAKINPEKTCYLNLKKLNLEKSPEFDYLGYTFKYEIKGKEIGTLKFKFGISNKKIDKEKARIDKIIRSYGKNQNEHLLLTRLDLYYKRFVFLNHEKEKKYVWESRGISQTYREARKLIELKDNKFESSTLIKSTLDFFRGQFIIGLFKKHGFTIPKEVYNHIKNRKLISNLYKNKAVILHKNVGYSYCQLTKVLCDCGIAIDSSMSYRTLSKKFKNRVYNL